MKRFSRAMVVAIVGTCLAAGHAAALAAETPEQSSRSALEGAWTAVSLVQAGSSVPDAQHRPLWFVFSEKTITIAVGAKFVAETPYTVDPKAKPAAIDMTFEGEATLGIYEIGKNELRICLNDLGKGRPKSVPAKAGAGCDIDMRLRRVKTAETDGGFRKNTDLMNKMVRAYRFCTVDEKGAKRPLDFNDGNLFAWSNPGSDVGPGGVYLWTRNGRPAAIMKVFWHPWSFPPSWCQNMHSLSTEKVSADEKDGVTFWRPQTAGVKMAPLPGVSPPGNSPAELAADAEDDRAVQRPRDAPGEIRMGAAAGVQAHLSLRRSADRRDGRGDFRTCSGDRSRSGYALGGAVRKKAGTSPGIMPLSASPATPRAPDISPGRFGP